MWVPSSGVYRDREDEVGETKGGSVSDIAMEMEGGDKEMELDARGSRV